MATKKMKTYSFYCSQDGLIDLAHHMGYCSDVLECWHSDYKKLGLSTWKALLRAEAKNVHKDDEKMKTLCVITINKLCDTDFDKRKICMTLYGTYDSEDDI